MTRNQKIKGVSAERVQTYAETIKKLICIPIHKQIDFIR
jgi:hypothetical protein